MKRLLLAALLGAIGMFIWMSIAHMVLPLGRIGVSEMSNEEPLFAAMQTSVVNQPGLYIFPSMGVGKNASRQEMNYAMGHYQEKLNTSPSGLLIYHPAGAKALAPSQLITEFLTELLEAYLAALLLAFSPIPSYARRVAFIVTVGVIAVLATNMPYWNWYGFPADYTISYMFTQLVGFLVLGLIAGKIMKTA